MSRSLRCPVGLALGLLAGLATAQVPVQTLSGQLPGESFGTGKASFGDLAAVRSTTRVDIFTRSLGQWSLTQSLPILSSEGTAGFGAPLELGAQRLLVGVPYGVVGDFSTGFVQVHRQTPSGFALEKMLYPPDPTNVGSFGWSVAQSGTRIAVGAPFYRKAFSSYGAAFVFESTGGWPAVEPIFSSDGKPIDNFGFAVAIDGDRLAVGARLHDAAGINSGAVYLYEYQAGSWQETQKLLPPDPTGAGEFGRSLQLSGARLVVGAPGALSYGGKKGGAVYAYRLGPSGFALESKLSASNPESGDSFGIHLDLVADRLAVGACYHDSAGIDDGAVYIFDSVGDWWIESARLTAPDLDAAALGGWSTTLAGDQLLVGGLPNYGSAVGAPGSVRVFAIGADQLCAGANYAQIPENPLSLISSPAKPGQTFVVSLLAQGAPAAQIWLAPGPAKVVLPFGVLAVDLNGAIGLPTAALQSAFLAVLPVPNLGSLVGQSVFLQGLALSPDIAQWRLSHGVRVTVCP
jgi:hypothetical protein